MRHCLELLDWTKRACKHYARRSLYALSPVRRLPIAHIVASAGYTTARFGRIALKERKKKLAWCGRMLPECLSRENTGRVETPQRRTELLPRKKRKQISQPDEQAIKRRSRRPRRRGGTYVGLSTAIYALLASSAQTVFAQQGCISLRGSTACPAFNASSISTNSRLVGLYPFLSDVTDRASFDSGLTSYVSGGYAQLKYASFAFRLCRRVLISLQIPAIARLFKFPVRQHHRLLRAIYDLGTL